MIFYTTNPMFNNEEFAEVLNKYNVKAEAAKDGVYFSREDFEQIKWSQVSHWIYMNKDFMKRAIKESERA
jgi:hypothetical protein